MLIHIFKTWKISECFLTLEVFFYEQHTIVKHILLSKIALIKSFWSKIPCDLCWLALNVRLKWFWALRFSEVNKWLHAFDLTHLHRLLSVFSSIVTLVGIINIFWTWTVNTRLIRKCESNECAQSKESKMLKIVYRFAHFSSNFIIFCVKTNKRITETKQFERNIWNKWHSSRQLSLFIIGG